MVDLCETTLHFYHSLPILSVASVSGYVPPYLKFNHLSKIRIYELYASRDKAMPKVPLAEAQSRLSELIDSVYESQKPIVISGQNQNGVLISEAAWRGIQETIYLLSIPKMGESIREGLLTPLNSCSEELDW
jgi:antitoxin YefM